MENKKTFQNKEVINLELITMQISVPLLNYFFKGN